MPPPDGDDGDSGCRTHAVQENTNSKETAEDMSTATRNAAAGITAPGVPEDGNRGEASNV